MHIMKCGISDYGKVRGEAGRENGFHSKVGTINPELTKYNYNLIDRDPPTDIDAYIKDLGVNRKIRADAVRCVSVIVDFPKDEKRPSAEFFADAIKGLQEHFGIKDDAILYAQVHVDEGHDHMHFAFVPLVEKEKTYKDGHTEKQVKLSAYEVLTREKLQELHPYMQKYMKERDYRGTLHYADGEKRDKDFLEHKIEKIKGELQSQELTLTSNSKKLELQKQHLKEGQEAVKKVDDIVKMMADEERESIHMENMTIPEKKSFFGKVEEPERNGVFIEDMDTKQMKALFQSATMNDRIERTFELAQKSYSETLDKAHKEAEKIKAEASAERNETVAKAEQILSQEQEILKRAEEESAKSKKEHEKLLQEIKALESKKTRLNEEIAENEAYKGKLAPLKKEVEDLTRARNIMSGDLDNEITQARFKTTWELRDGRSFGNDITFQLRDEGKLIALYNDGTQRIVGRNENGGFDNKTLADERKGLCKVGAFVEEERVRVPKSVLKELIKVRDREKPISQNLENLIKQQSDVERVTRSRSRER